MPSYNHMKRADRDQHINDLKSEIAAVDNCLWPRDSNDRTRWDFSNAWWIVDCQPLEPDTYAKYMCQKEIAYLEDIQVRIKAGELPGWEA